ncbi:MAG: hypothetical protein LBG30_00730, partial [Odoribacteraceae bacterium]|nr:hypothetical protein [Odoribacteraceae bacterium]
MKTLFTLLWTLVALQAAGQRVYSANENAHSHNDYLQPAPFHTARAHRFGSIEVDVHLVDGQLLAAHARDEARADRTLEALYIRPIVEAMDGNNGNIYTGGGKLQLLVDIKGDADSTLRALERLLQPLRRYFDPGENAGAVRVVISGNAPPPPPVPPQPPLVTLPRPPPRPNPPPPGAPP